MGKNGKGEVGLVLTRATDERILIGDDIVITLVEVRKGFARIGVKAPAHVQVDREEIRELKQRHTGAGMREGEGDA